MTLDFTWSYLYKYKSISQFKAKGRGGGDNHKSIALWPFFSLFAESTKVQNNSETPQ